MRLTTILLTYCFCYTTADNLVDKNNPPQPICNDSCQFANNGKCDDAAINVGGDCPRGTDCMDCCGGDPLCPILARSKDLDDDLFEGAAKGTMTEGDPESAAEDAMTEGGPESAPHGAPAESAAHGAPAEGAPQAIPKSAPAAMPESAPEAIPESAGAPDTILVEGAVATGTILESDFEASPTSVCEDSCIFAMDGVCDDGRYGLQAFCQPGTDCQDCGPADAASLIDDYFFEAYAYDEPDDYFEENDSRLRLDSNEDTSLFAQGLTSRTFDQIVNEMAMPAIDIEIVVEEDDEYEIVVEDDSYPDHRPRWAWFAVFFLGMAGGCFGFLLSQACMLGFHYAAPLRKLRRADARAATKYSSGQRSHSDDAPNTMPLLV